MRKRRQGGPVPLADVLRERFSQLGWERKMREQEILSRWEEAVGPQIAGRTRPVEVRNRRLTVAVDSPAWAQQLSFLKKDLLRRFETLLGAGAIEDIFITGGPVNRERAETPAPEEEEIPLTSETVHAIDDEASRISDVELREAFRNTLLAASRRRKDPLR
jgi:hypothetical protein